jgi:diguanylate cyclase (GGDEF)-like protein/PAS domain S-box-containing protein
MEKESEIKDYLQKLQASETRYRRLFETAQDGILILNAETGEIDDVNPYMINMLHYSHEEFLGMKLWEVSPFRDTVLNQAAFEELQDKGYIKYKDLPLETKEGKHVAVEFVSNVYKVNGNKVIQCNIRNITERKSLEAKLLAMSISDELTGLYNRRGFFTLARQQLKVAERTKQNMLLFFADLDQMKQINDTLGHQEGDKALVDIATILKEVFRESDIIGRMGGDEFAVLAIDTSDETRDVLVNRLHNILDDYNRPEGRNYQLSLSIGIAHYDPEKPSTLDELMAQADTLMYEEKRNKQQK